MKNEDIKTAKIEVVVGTNARTTQVNAVLKNGHKYGLPVTRLDITSTPNKLTVVTLRIIPDKIILPKGLKLFKFIFNNLRK